MASVNIKVKFTASIANKVGMEQIMIDVSDDFDEAISTIRKFVQNKGGKTILFSILYQGINYALAKKNGAQIKAGDEFSVVPTVLGG